MASFINLLANDVWSEADIVNRTEAMISSEFPPAQVAILNRIATAAAIGEYTLTAEEQAEIARYNAVCLQAREAGQAARADMALLAKAMEYERAQAVIAAADEETTALVALRNPPPEPEPEPLPEVLP